MVGYASGSKCSLIFYITLSFFFFFTISNKLKGLQYHIAIFTINNKLIVYNVVLSFFFFFFFSYHSCVVASASILSLFIDLIIFGLFIYQNNKFRQETRKR